MDNKEKIIIGSLIGFGLIATGAFLYLIVSNRKEKDEQSVKESDALEEMKQTPLLSTHVKQSQKSVQSTLKEVAPVNTENPTISKQKEEQKTPGKLEESVKKETLTTAEEVNIKPDIAPQNDILSPVADEFPLRLGSKGKRVERLQVWLQKNYGTFGIINDTFDRNLEKIVIKRFKRPFVTESDYKTKQMELPVHHQQVDV